MDEYCLFCEKITYKTEDSYVLCGGCVIKLFDMSIKEKIRLRELCEKKGYDRKIMALNMFMEVSKK